MEWAPRAVVSWQADLVVSRDAFGAIAPSHDGLPSARERRRRFVSSVLFAGAVLTAALGTVGYTGGLRINFTPSYPLGLWRVVALDREVAVGDLVFVCPPQTPAFEMGLARGYLRRGLCPGWMSPLIKTVAAVAGQSVDVGSSLHIDGVALPNSTVRPVDAEGRALVAYAGGTVPDGEIFLHSSFPGSYDSRYFGPVPVTGVLGLARPIAVIEP